MDLQLEKKNLATLTTAGKQTTASTIIRLHYNTHFFLAFSMIEFTRLLQETTCLKYRF